MRESFQKDMSDERIERVDERHCKALEADGARKFEETVKEPFQRTQGVALPSVGGRC
jgi:hypothetical protein